MEQVIFIEADEIALYIAQDVLFPFESSCSLNYFRDTESALNYIRGSKSSNIDRANVFICSEALMDDKDSINLIKAALPSCFFQFFLLTTSLKLTRLEKQFIDERDFTCFVERPINEHKFQECLENSFEAA